MLCHKYCALPHNTCTGWSGADSKGGGGKGAGRAAGQLSVQHTKLARQKGTYPMTLARQVAEIWGQQEWRMPEKHRRSRGVVPRADVMGQRELEERSASWLAAGSLGSVEEELRMLKLEIVVALEVLEAEGAAEAMPVEVARASEAVEEAEARVQEEVSKAVKGAELIWAAEEAARKEADAPIQIWADQYNSCGTARPIRSAEIPRKIQFFLTHTLLRCRHI